MAQAKGDQVKPAEPQPSVITASAMTLQNVSTNPGAWRQDEGWQSRAWYHYHRFGALYYAATVTGNTMGKATMKCVQRTDDGTKPGSAKGVAATKAWFGGPVGQSQSFTKVGVYTMVAGEYYFVGREGEKGKRTWYCLASTEVRPSSVMGAFWEMKGDDGVQWVPLAPGKDIVIRAWYPDPQDRMRAISPVRPLLPVLDRIEQIGMHIDAQLNSRLTGSGLLLLPSDMTPPTRPPNLSIPPEVSSPPDLVMWILLKMMEANKGAPGSAAAQVPITLTMQGDYIDKVKLIHFWSELDGKVTDMLSQAYDEFAIGMNMPVETILGAGNSSHWNAWAADESYIKAHIEPGLELAAAAITEGYIQAIPGIDPNDIIAIDTTGLRVRPDRSKDAQALGAAWYISDAAVRRENGFGEEDAPKKEEIERKILISMARGQTTPEFVYAAANALGVQLPESVLATAGATQEARPTPRTNEQRIRPPDPSQSEAIGHNPYELLMAAAEPLVFRALEKVGARMASKYITAADFKAMPARMRYMNFPASRLDLDDLTKDIWDDTEHLLERYGDPKLIIEAMDAYVRELLTEKLNHNPRLLEAGFQVRLGGMQAVLLHG